MADLGLGTDVAVTTGLPRRRKLVSGTANFAQAIVRRLTTPRGALAVVGEDPNYGHDVRQYLHREMTRAQIAAAEQAIADEVEKDERVAAATVTLALDAQASQLTLDITVETADGPFTLILSISDITVEILQAA